MSRTNLSTNPTLGVDLVGWNVGSGTTTLTRDTTTFHTSIASCKATKSSTGTTVPNHGFLPVTIGQTYTASAWLNIPAGTFSSFNPISIYWYNGATFLSSTSSGTTIPANTGNGGTWTRYSVTGTAPASTTQCVIVFNNGQSMNSGYAFYIDDVLFEQSATLGTYFDGSTAADATYTYSWTGTAYDSTSLATDVVVGSTSPKVRVGGVATLSSKKVRVAGASTAATRRVRVGGVAT